MVAACSELRSLRLFQESKALRILMGNQAILRGMFLWAAEEYLIDSLLKNKPSCFPLWEPPGLYPVVLGIKCWVLSMCSILLKQSPKFQTIVLFYFLFWGHALLITPGRTWGKYVSNSGWSHARQISYLLSNSSASLKNQNCFLWVRWSGLYTSDAWFTLGFVLRDHSWLCSENYSWHCQRSNPGQLQAKWTPYLLYSHSSPNHLRFMPQKLVVQITLSFWALRSRKHLGSAFGRSACKCSEYHTHWPMYATIHRQTFSLWSAENEIQAPCPPCLQQVSENRITLR